MEAQNRRRFNEMLGVFFGYYGEELTAPVAELYWLGLNQFDADVIERSFAKHMQDPKSGQFRPKVADIIRQIVDAAGGDAGLRAWTALVRAMSRVGQYQSIEFEDSVTGSVVEAMGGWPALCRTDEDEWPFVRNEFVRRYEGHLTRGEVPARKRLSGVCEHTNSAQGFLDPTWADGVAPAILARRDGRFEVLPAQRVAALPEPQLGAKVAEETTAPLAGALKKVMARLKPPENAGI